MNWSREEVSRLLNAEITDEESASGDHICIVRFRDNRILCELWIHQDGVFLAADYERPIQGLPLFEISLPCAQIAPVPRSGMPTGIGIYSGPVSPRTLLFLITRREDGNISLSGGLSAAHQEQQPKAE